jgi:aryl-alcohol dehydrogenase-like predicted oxidoreductase
MRMRWLGKTGLQVSELCLGTATFGGRGKFKNSGELDQKGATQIVNMAFDAGINFFNTAEVYSSGLAEEIFGKALGARRKDAIVITKVNQRVAPGKNDGGLSRKHIIEACEASLRRIGTDYIDIYELHGIDPNTSLEETMRALDELVSQGKVRYIGCSNFCGWQLVKCMAISEKNGWNRFITLESMYSLAARGLEYELVPACLDQGVAILAYSPLHAGLLSGKYRRDKPWPTGTRIRSQKEAGAWSFKPEILFEIIDELDRIATERNVTVPQVALNYVLQKPSICSIIIAARNAPQMEENLKTMEWQITPGEIARLDKVSEPEHMYPYDIDDPKSNI